MGFVPVRLRILVLLLCVGGNGGLLRAQMPFYTDNAEVTAKGTLHFETFNEYDRLQAGQFPNLRQNTFNYKINYGLPHGLELDVDAPLLAILRAPGSENASGPGDTDMGIKWYFHQEGPPLRAPGVSASLYIEFPTGDVKEQLGSGLRDYWLNSIAEEPLSEKTRVNANFGFLFAGNTSTGVLGTQNTRGHVYTGGLSWQHDVSERVTLGAELWGADADNKSLGKDELQGLAGGWYQITKRFAVTFAVLGGSHIASPTVGGQVGIEGDFPMRRHGAN